MATAVEAALHIFISPTRFRDMVSQGIFRRMPSKGYVLDEVRETYCKHMQRVAAGRASDGGASLSAQRVRLEGARTQAIEMKNAIMSQDYVSMTAVKAVFSREFMGFRERVLSVPGATADSLTPYCARDRGQIEEILRDKLYECLEDLSSGEFLDEVEDTKARRRGRRATDAIAEPEKAIA